MGSPHSSLFRADGNLTLITYRIFMHLFFPWVPVSSKRFGKFSAIISLNKLSTPFPICSFGDCHNENSVHFGVSHDSLRISLLFFVPFSPLGSLKWLVFEFRFFCWSGLLLMLSIVVFSGVCLLVMFPWFCFVCVLCLKQAKVCCWCLYIWWSNCLFQFLWIGLVRKCLHLWEDVRALAEWGCVAVLTLAKAQWCSSFEALSAEASIGEDRSDLYWPRLCVSLGSVNSFGVFTGGVSWGTPLFSLSSRGLSGQTSPLCVRFSLQGLLWQPWC